MGDTSFALTRRPRSRESTLPFHRSKLQSTGGPSLIPEAVPELISAGLTLDETGLPVEHDTGTPRQLGLCHVLLCHMETAPHAPRIRNRART